MNPKHRKMREGYDSDEIAQLPPPRIWLAAYRARKPDSISVKGGDCAMSTKPLEGTTPVLSTPPPSMSNASTTIGDRTMFTKHLEGTAPVLSTPPPSKPSASVTILSELAIPSELDHAVLIRDAGEDTVHPRNGNQPIVTRGYLAG